MRRPLLPGVSLKPRNLLLEAQRRRARVGNAEDFAGDDEAAAPAAQGLATRFRSSAVQPPRSLPIRYSRPRVLL